MTAVVWDKCQGKSCDARALCERSEFLIRFLQVPRRAMKKKLTTDSLQLLSKTVPLAAENFSSTESPLFL